MKIVSTSSKSIICNSYAVMNNLKKRMPEYKNFKIAYNGFDFPKTSECEPALKKIKQCIKDISEFKIVIVGTISPGKGHEDAIHALSHLINRGFKVRLSIVGTGRGERIQNLKTLANALSISAQIDFEGFKKDVKEMYTNSAITLICSRCEAFGRTAVESLSFQTPVIGTRSGGLQEIIQHGVNGLLYSHGDHEMLADCIASLLTDTDLYFRLIQNSRKSVIERFSMDSYTSNIQDCIDSIL
ncbi:hypothetical protein DSLASN_02940 [Desulfoluna limicola]|uniref:Glycosyl transferase family 1 domain-containing protein n=2 Tax=Desulfoluna limicola TaxID=2810562 RepID=A0ABM7PC76_9BACT|nr:hypothetical protein DSLASN_02940 [Desulfoluna limicola]